MAKELAARGHNVTIVSPHPEKNRIPGLREIIHPSPFEDFSDAVSKAVLQEDSVGSRDIPIKKAFEITIESNREALIHRELREIIYNDKIKVDVLMTIPMFGNEAAYFISERKNASLVHFTTLPFLLPWVASAGGNPVHPAYMPLPFLPFRQEMSLKERVINTVGTIGLNLVRRFYILPKIEMMLGEVFPGEKIPDLHQASQKAALSINLGSPFMGDGLRPTMPNTVLAGLMSCEPGGELAAGELRDWIHGAKHGVVFLSFGSVAKASLMPESRRKLIVSALAKLKQRVVWKWEKEMADLPTNVKVFPWVPQKDVLADENVKVFITHGGAGSLQETICHETPIVGIPLQGDQINNMVEASSKNLGVVLSWRELTVETLVAAVNKVAGDPSYKLAISTLRNLILDTPLHPRDSAVWWLEYLLRHPGNPGMESPVHSLNWVQYYLLDVIFVLVALLVLVLFLFKKLLVLTLFPFKKLLVLTLYLFKKLTGKGIKQSSEKNKNSEKKRN